MVRIALGWLLAAQVELIWALVARMAPRWPLEAHFELIWALVARMAPRWLLEAQFELIWALDANFYVYLFDYRWLSDFGVFILMHIYVIIGFWAAYNHVEMQESDFSEAFWVTWDVNSCAYLHDYGWLWVFFSFLWCQLLCIFTIIMGDSRILCFYGISAFIEIYLIMGWLWVVSVFAAFRNSRKNAVKLRTCALRVRKNA